MPQWGRPSGARLGRPTRGRVAVAQRMWEDLQVGVDGDTGKAGGRWKYDDADEIGSVDGVEYDLYDDSDSTVAYAIELAMRDKDEWLVERAVERIRRAKSSGQNNVRLTKRELEAFERKRMRQTSGNDKGTTRQAWQAPDSPTNGQPQRKISGASQHQMLPDGPWARSTGDLPQSSPPRPRTPLAQTLRTQHSDASLRSPHWARPSQLPSYPTPVRTGSFPRRGSDERNISNNPLESSRRPISVGSDSEHDNNDKGKEEDSGDEVQIIDVVQRRVPLSPPRRSRGNRR